MLKQLIHRMSACVPLGLVGSSTMIAGPAGKASKRIPDSAARNVSIVVGAHCTGLFDVWIYISCYLEDSPDPTYRQVKQPDFDLGGRRGVGDPADEFERTDPFMVEPIGYPKSRVALRVNEDVKAEP